MPHDVSDIVFGSDGAVYVPDTGNAPARRSVFVGYALRRDELQALGPNALFTWPRLARIAIGLDGRVYVEERAIGAAGRRCFRGYAASPSEAAEIAEEIHAIAPPVHCMFCGEEVSLGDMTRALDYVSIAALTASGHMPTRTPPKEEGFSGRPKREHLNLTPRATKIKNLILGIDFFAQGIVAGRSHPDYRARGAVIEALAFLITKLVPHFLPEIKAILADDEARIVLELPGDALERLAKLRRISGAKTSVEVIVAALAAREAELKKKGRRRRGTTTSSPAIE